MNQSGDSRMRGGLRKGGGVYLGLKNLLSLILHTFDYKKVIYLPYRWCDVTAILLLAKE